MLDKKSDLLELSRQREAALSRWDNEGGAGPDGPQEGSFEHAVASDVPSLTNAELVKLRVRIIAFENVMIRLLATAAPEHFDIILGMAAYISPRPGLTQHKLTIRAATQMRNLVERAEHFRAP